MGGQRDSERDADPRLRFERVAEIGSTSSELLQRPFAPEPATPVVLLADRQTAGRGRNGRGWLADPQASLAFSIGLERSLDAGARSLLGLPLVVGLAVAERLEAFGVQVMLKWPNDVMRERADGRWGKAGGILVETRQSAGVQRIVIGCGLNLRAAPALDAASQAVAALFDSGEAPPREALAAAIAARVLEDFRRFLESGLEPFADRWRRHDWLAGSAIDVLLPDGTRIAAVARGVDRVGGLVVEADDGLRTLLSGEISVRRR